MQQVDIAYYYIFRSGTMHSKESRGNENEKSNIVTFFVDIYGV